MLKAVEIKACVYIDNFLNQSSEYVKSYPKRVSVGRRSFNKILTSKSPDYTWTHCDIIGNTLQRALFGPLFTHLDIRWNGLGIYTGCDHLYHFNLVPLFKHLISSYQC